MIERFHDYYVNMDRIGFVSPIRYNKSRAEYYAYFRVDGENVSIASSSDIDVVKQQRDLFITRWRKTVGNKGNIKGATYTM